MPVPNFMTSSYVTGGSHSYQNITSGNNICNISPEVVDRCPTCIELDKMDLRKSIYAMLSIWCCNSAGDNFYHIILCHRRYDTGTKKSYQVTRLSYVSWGSKPGSTCVGLNKIELRKPRYAILAIWRHNSVVRLKRIKQDQKYKLCTFYTVRKIASTFLFLSLCHGHRHIPVLLAVSAFELSDDCLLPLLDNHNRNRNLHCVCASRPS